MSLPAAALLVLLTSMSAKAAEPDTAPGDSEHCRRVQPGMDYRDTLRIMQRAPDSVLSGHTAEWNGSPPGSYAIEFWHETDAAGVPRTSSLRIVGSRVTEVDCGRPDAVGGA